MAVHVLEQLRMDPPTHVPGKVRFEDLADRRFGLFFRFKRPEPGLVIEERESGQPGGVK